MFGEICTAVMGWVWVPMWPGARMGWPVAAATWSGEVYSCRWLLPTGTEVMEGKLHTTENTEHIMHWIKSLLQSFHLHQLALSGKDTIATVWNYYSMSITAKVTSICQQPDTPLNVTTSLLSPLLGKRGGCDGMAKGCEVSTMWGMPTGGPVGICGGWLGGIWVGVWGRGGVVVLGERCQEYTNY